MGLLFDCCMFIIPSATAADSILKISVHLGRLSNEYLLVEMMYYYYPVI